MHKTSSRFWKCFDQLPKHIQQIANENFELLKTDPFHPSLHFKKIGSIWSVRIGLSYRTLAIKDAEDFIWVWIGNHDEYERMLRL